MKMHICHHLRMIHYFIRIYLLVFLLLFLNYTSSRFVDLGFAGAVHLLKNMGLRRQAVSHLQHPSGPAVVSRLLSVSEARVWSVDMEEMSLTEEEGGRLSLFMAAPALREVPGKKRLQRKKEAQPQHPLQGKEILQADVQILKSTITIKYVQISHRDESGLFKGGVHGLGLDLRWYCRMLRHLSKAIYIDINKSKMLSWTQWE